MPAEANRPDRKGVARTMIAVAAFTGLRRGEIITRQADIKTLPEQTIDAMEQFEQRRETVSPTAQ